MAVDLHPSNDVQMVMCSCLETDTVLRSLYSRRVSCTGLGNPQSMPTAKQESVDIRLPGEMTS